MISHHTRNSCGKKTGIDKIHPNNYTERRRDPKQRQLTGSLVFDEEQLEALLESVFIHIELYLHPKRGTERWAETERDRNKKGAREKSGNVHRKRCSWLKRLNTCFKVKLRSTRVETRSELGKGKRIKVQEGKSVQLSKLENERVIMIIWTLKSMEIRHCVWLH